VALDRASITTDHPRLYLNRLSDLLFIVSRCLNKMADVADVTWTPAIKSPTG
jgi:cob(I)alamin adenosyltransferase